jgi:hypothetical protein
MACSDTGAAHAASDRWVAPNRVPLVAFNTGACVWQLREAASWRAMATRLWCLDWQATVEENSH